MKNYLKNGGLIIAGSVVGVSSAFAALDVGVTTAITDAGTDGKLLAGMVLTVIIGIVAFKYLRKAT